MYNTFHKTLGNKLFIIIKILFQLYQTLHMSENERFQKKKAIIQHFDRNGFPYFCFLGNVSKYGNHVTLDSKQAHQLSDELLAAEEKKMPSFY